MSQTKAQLIDNLVQPITGALGSASAPAFSFTSDPNSGLYSPGADQLALGTGGSGRLFVDASGRLYGTNYLDAGIVNSFVIRQSVGLTDSAALIESITSAAGERFALAFRSAATAGNASGSIVGSLSYTNTLFNYNTINAHVFKTAGSERLRITVEGLVGVGTSTPNSFLHVLGGSANIGLYNGTPDNGADRGLTITTNRTSGSGEVKPFLEFFSARSYATAAVGQGRFYYNWSTGLVFENGTGSIASNTITPGAYTGRFCISPTGFVGIGTTAPQVDFQIGNADGSSRDIVVHTANNGNARLRFREGGTLASGYNEYSFGMVGNANAMSWESQGLGEIGRWDSSGRLLVGTSSSTTGSIFTKAEFVNNATFTDVVVGRGDGASGADSIIGVISFASNAGSTWQTHASIYASMDAASGNNDKPGRLVFSTTADGASTPTERMRIRQDGRVLINTTDTVAGDTGFLTVVGGTVTGIVVKGGSNNYMQAFYNTSNALIGSITGSNGTSTAYNTSSDYRLKENVNPVTDGISRLQQLKPSRFNFIADPNRTIDGFIAHEVQAVVPEAITGGKDAVDADGNPQYQGIDQSKLVPLLTAALQEAIAEIASLKNRVAALEAV